MGISVQLSVYACNLAIHFINLVSDRQVYIMLVSLPLGLVLLLHWCIILLYYYIRTYKYGILLDS